MADIEFEIDGQTLTAKPNETIIQVADAAGIYIPRFCYHKHLAIAANCRMCLVEVEKSPKALPACATPVMPGMKVFTKSQKTIAAQRAVMEFLLINHPLDCPICDQGGECELQDLSMGYGSCHSHYDEPKRSVADLNFGPLIESEMTRCIYCTRCVRFGDEIAGMREMGAIGRGEDTEIGTYIKHTIHSEVSGNIIDLCPVGALTSKPYRFTARAWELEQAPSVSPHDCMGTNVNVHTRYGLVKRVVTRENAAINETWITDRDRFGYTGLYHPDRLEEPMMRVDGRWQAVDWQTALQAASDGLQKVIAEHGADKLGALASPNCTLEEFYLLQKIMRGLGSTHIDHRLRSSDTKDQEAMGAFPGLTMPIDELEQCDAILLIGSNLQKEQPIAALRIRKAGLKGASILAINPVDYNFNFKVTEKEIVAPHALPNAVKKLAEEMSNPNHAIAAALNGKQKVCVIVGALAMHHPKASAIRAYAQQIANTVKAKLGFMTDGANSAGAWLAGAVPHRHAGGNPIHQTGLNAHDMLDKTRKGYVLLNVEPDFDCANPSHAVAAMKQAQCVVALSLYRNAALEEHADIILPIAPFTETSGTFVNITGEWQSFKGTAKPFGNSRPAWKVLRVLGNFLHLDGFDYEDSESIKHEVHALISNMTLEPQSLASFAASTHEEATHLSRIGEIPIYNVDSIVRRAKPLQETQTVMLGNVNVARMHTDTAAKLGLEENATVKVSQPHGGHTEVSIMFDDRIAKEAIWLAGATDASRQLGCLMGSIEIQKV